MENSEADRSSTNVSLIIVAASGNFVKKIIFKYVYVMLTSCCWFTSRWKRSRHMARVTDILLIYSSRSLETFDRIVVMNWWWLSSVCRMQEKEDRFDDEMKVFNMYRRRSNNRGRWEMKFSAWEWYTVTWAYVEKLWIIYAHHVIYEKRMQQRCCTYSFG